MVARGYAARHIIGRAARGEPDLDVVLLCPGRQGLLQDFLPEAAERGDHDRLLRLRGGAHDDRGADGQGTADG
jgi:hypothetical protein